MSYVIRRVGDGAFVAPPGQRASYTFVLQYAQVFTTQEQAERNKCGNEVVVPIEEVFTFKRV